MGICKLIPDEMIVGATCAIKRHQNPLATPRDQANQYTEARSIFTSGKASPPPPSLYTLVPYLQNPPLTTS